MLFRSDPVPGNLAMPPRFVTNGATVPSILDPAKPHLYGIWLAERERLTVDVVPQPDTAGPVAIVVAGPVEFREDAASMVIDWAAYDAQRVATGSGVYLIGIYDMTSGGLPYRYAATFAVIPAPPIVTVPADGSALGGEVEIGDQASTVVDAVLLANGARIHGVIGGSTDRPASFAIDLAFGDRLTVTTEPPMNEIGRAHV